ncbi:hypothetical protein ABH935_005413 [Catenulispora sp. GAS73]|uniref:hypothetical protein n=1 Tax=Catenulispora sp. GAS73 TaxID=3156269 RepID=UPI003514365B
MPAHIHARPTPPDPISITMHTTVDTKARRALSAVLTDYAADLSSREDLIVTVAPGVRDTYSAPALIHFPSATIHIDASLFETGPDGTHTVAPEDPHARPVGFGALVHEAAHAAHTRWKVRLPQDTDQAAFAAADLIEEIRAEAAQLVRRPADARWLRAMAAELVLEGAPVSGDDSPWAAARAALLVAGRVDNGTLTISEARPVVLAAKKVLGSDLLKKLRVVWKSATQLADDDTDGMIAAGRAWCDLLNIAPDKPEPTPTHATGGRRPAELVAQAVKATAAKVRINSAAESRNSGPSPAEAAAAERSEQAHTANIAAGVFAPHSPCGQVTGSRPPTAVERRAAARLAQQLRRAAVRERAATPTASALPPGRLNVRAALAKDAQRAAGVIPTAEPWRAVNRKTTPTPPLRIGIVVDTSASMSAFTEPIASIAWILARAAALSATDATTAAVHFSGKTAAAITRPGDNPAQVSTFKADNGGHPIGTAIDAVDGGLGLARPGAARLLVIVSDGVFTDSENNAARKRTERLVGTGCPVLQVTTADQKKTRQIPGATRVRVANAAAAGDAIGAAAVKALATA